MKTMHPTHDEIEAKKRLAKILFQNACHLEELESEQAKHVHALTYLQETFTQRRERQEKLKSLKKEIAKAENEQAFSQAQFDAIKTDL